jgi:hypothetical protein
MAEQRHRDRAWIFQLLAVTGLLLSTGLQAAQSPEAPIEILDEALVIGEQPGPALWQVKSGSNVLWILAETRVVPRKLKWRSKQVEKVLAGASELLVNDGGERPASTAEEKAAQEQRRKNMAAWAERRLLPGGRTLRDLLSAQNYARYMAASAAYAKGEKYPDRLDPGHATSLLGNGAIRTLKLAISPVAAQVIDMAGRRNIKVSRVEPTIWFGPDTLDEAGLTNTCDLENLLEELADNAARFKARINAWSLGDVDRLRALERMSSRAAVANADGSACVPDAEDSAAWLQAKEASARHVEQWLAATEGALARNASTLAVLGISDVLAPNGVLDALRSRGYEVVDPS